MTTQDLKVPESLSMWQTCLTLGRFDGLHRGHRSVIDTLVQIGAKRHLTPILISKDCDESETESSCLTCETEKKILLQDSGLDAMLSVKADGYDTGKLLDYARCQLDTRVLVVGENHGELDLLRDYAATYNLELITCEVVTADGEAVSRDRAAAALDALDFPLVNRLLGHPYFICGVVGYGKQIGRTIALPTANIGYAKNKYLPREGSYGAVTHVDGTPYMGTANVGRRPTVDKYDYVTVENHLLDFSGDLYGKLIRMDLRVPIRGVSKFENLQELREQVAKDILFVRSQLAGTLEEYQKLAKIPADRSH